MRRTTSNVVRVFGGIICLIIYLEWFNYYVILYQCDWPILNIHSKDLTIEHNEKELRTLVVSDLHLLGSRKGYWFDKVLREWQMHRAFQTAITLHQPHAVFVLGDLTEEGEYCSQEEFDDFVKRFKTTFAVPSATIVHLVVGNHDIGFHYSVTPYLNNRFVKGFNASEVQVVTLNGNHFVLVNSIGLQRDGCFLCKETELKLAQIQKTLKCLKHNETCEANTLGKYSPPILITHFPLYRESDELCHEPDEAPFSEKTEKFKESWDCLSKNSTNLLLNQIEPRLVLTGHTHHGCTSKLSVGEGVEITIPSFNWRHKNNPSYGLFVLTPNNYAFSKCLMPKQSTVICCYILGVGLLAFWAVYRSYFQNRLRIYMLLKPSVL